MHDICAYNSYGNFLCRNEEMNLVLTNVGNHLLHIQCSVGYARKSLNDMQDPTVVIQVKSCLVSPGNCNQRPPRGPRGQIASSAFPIDGPDCNTQFFNVLPAFTTLLHALIPANCFRYCQFA